jgi:DNA-binding transcriptional MerR regulator
VSETSSDVYGIAELAQVTGLTPRTIRYYITEGLIPPPAGAGPYRTYSRDHLLRLQAIKRLKARYLPLGEIRRQLSASSPAELADLARGSTTKPALTALEYLEAIRARQLPASPLPPPPASLAPSIFAALGQPPAAPAPPLQLGYAESFAPSEPIEQTSRSAPATRESVWHRIVLAPGVELSYQLSGERERDEAVIAFVRAARALAERGS